MVTLIQALAESVKPRDYLKKLRKRDEELGSYLGTNCPHVEMLTETGKKRSVLADFLPTITINSKKYCS